MNRYFKDKDWLFNFPSYLTISEDFGEWEEFLKLSGGDDNPEFKEIYELLWTLYGNVPLTYQAPDDAKRLYKIIDFENTKLRKVNSLYDLEIEKLTGEYEKTETYSYGRISKEQDFTRDDLKFSDKGVEVIKNDDLLSKIEKFQKMKLPIETSANNIMKRIINPYVRFNNNLIEKMNGGK